MLNPKLSKDIEKESVDIARILKPHLENRPVINVSDGSKKEAKPDREMNVIMDGTEKTFEFPSQYGFSNIDSVAVTLHPLSTVSMYAEMVAGNKFRITAASSVTSVKVKVLMRGY